MGDSVPVLNEASKSMPTRHLTAAGLEQEPRSPFRLINPYLDQARGGDIAMFLAYVMRLSQSSCQRLVVFAQLGQHVLRFDIIRVVVCDALQSRDVTDGCNRRPA